MTDHAEPRTSERSAGFVPRIMGFLAIAALGMPLAVLAAYYLLGWQAAVLLFPVLFVATFSRLGGKRSRPKSWFKFTLVMTILVGIPLAAVLTGFPEIMRLWAYAVAIPTAVEYGRGKKFISAERFDLPARSADLVARMASGLGPALFLIGSELIWLWSSMSTWIWYHAFSFPILIVLSVAVSMLADRVLPVKPTNIEEGTAPPRADGDTSEMAPVVIRKQPVGPGLNYKDVSLSQMKAILAEMDWSGGAVEVSDLAEVGNGQPETSLMTTFMNGTVHVVRDGDHTVLVRWNYFEPAPRRVMGHLKMYCARRVPLSLVTDVLDAIWADRWEDVAGLLDGYAKPVQPRR